MGPRGAESHTGHRRWSLGWEERHGGKGEVGRPEELGTRESQRWFEECRKGSDRPRWKEAEKGEK